MGLSIEDYKEILSQVTDFEISNDKLQNIKNRIDGAKEETELSGQNGLSDQATPAEKLTFFLNTKVVEPVLSAFKKK